jgi:hypothetical protein
MKALSFVNLLLVLSGIGSVPRTRGFTVTAEGGKPKHALNTGPLHSPWIPVFLSSTPPLPLASVLSNHLNDPTDQPTDPPPPPNHRQREMREMVLPPVTLLFRQKLPHFRDYCRESQYCVGGSPSQLSCYFLSATITTTAANDATFPSYQGHLFPTRLARVKEVLDFLDKYSHRNCHHRHIIVGGEYL